MTRAAAILIVGPTGSGKTPLGDCLQGRGLRQRPCRHFDFGRHLRSVAAAPPAFLSPSEVAVVRSCLRTGALLDDEQFPIAEKILEAFLACAPVAADCLIVLNGLPRHAGQALRISRLVDVRAVVELRCSEHAVLQRIDTNIAGDRAGRTDDALDAVRRRIALYNERTVPLLDYYRRLAVPVEVIDVGAETTADVVRRQLDERRVPGLNLG